MRITEIKPVDGVAYIFYNQQQYERVVYLRTKLSDVIAYYDRNIWLIPDYVDSNPGSIDDGLSEEDEDDYYSSQRLFAVKDLHHALLIEASFGAPGGTLMEMENDLVESLGLVAIYQDGTTKPMNTKMNYFSLGLGYQWLYTNSIGIRANYQRNWITHEMYAGADDSEYEKVSYKGNLISSNSFSVGPIAHLPGFKFLDLDKNNDITFDLVAQLQYRAGKYHPLSTLLRAEEELANAGILIWIDPKYKSIDISGLSYRIGSGLSIRVDNLLMSFHLMYSRSRLVHTPSVKQLWPITGDVLSDELYLSISLGGFF